VVVLARTRAAVVEAANHEPTGTGRPCNRSALSAGRTRMDLFAYGTLVDTDLVAQLTGKRFRTEPATLRGYRKVRGDSGYPNIVRDPQGMVDGVLLCDVDDEALHAFDRYEDEGRLYRRIEVIVTVAQQPRAVLVYVEMPIPAE